MKPFKIFNFGTKNKKAAAKVNETGTQVLAEHDVRYVDGSLDHPIDRFVLKHAFELSDFERKIIDLKDRHDYEGAIKALEKLEQFCNNKGKYGRQYFEQTHMRGHLHRDASLRDVILQQKEKHEKKLAFEQKLTIKGHIMHRQIADMIKSTPGILQKDVYKAFQDDRDIAIFIVNELYKDGHIKKEKISNTFSLHWL
jgi:hypothetical protein